MLLTATLVTLTANTPENLLAAATRRHGIELLRLELVI